MKNSWTVILALILTAIIIVAALNLQVFPETIFNKKRLDSGNLTYPSNVYHHRRIDNPNQVLQLEMAKVKKKIQYLNDLQIESREFLFHNGDIYWHDKITFPDGANNLNYVLNYKGSHGTLTYYHESTGKWKVEELSNGNLPLSDLFLTIDNKHIILNQPFIYQI